MTNYDVGQIEMIAILVAVIGTGIIVPLIMTYGARLVQEIKELFYAFVWLFKTVFRNVN